MLVRFLLFLFVITPNLLFSIQIDSLETILPGTTGEDRVNTLNDLFKNYYNNDPFTAMDYSEEAYQLARKINYKKGVATSLNNKGVIFRIRGQLDKALEFFIESYKIHFEISNKAGLAKVLNNIGTIYSIKKDYQTALFNYRESYEILQEIGNKEEIIGSLNNIGNVHREQNQFDEALSYYEKALEIEKEIGQRSTTFDPMTNIGNIYFNKNDFEKALEFYFQSLEFERSHKNLYGQAYALSNIGITYHEKKEYKMAISFQNQALNLAQIIEDNVLLNNIYPALAQSFYENDDLLKAYNALLLYTAAKDSLFNDESSRRISQLELEFEFMRKENEEELEQKDENIKVLESKNEQITSLLVIITSIFIISILVGLYRNATRTRKFRKT